jgi:hypothetical protein
VGLREPREIAFAGVRFLRRRAAAAAP